jgi:hypothetical protein
MITLTGSTREIKRRAQTKAFETMMSAKMRETEEETIMRS